MKTKAILLTIILFSQIIAFANIPPFDFSKSSRVLYKPNPKISKSDFKLMYMDAQDLFNYGYYAESLVLFKKLLATDIYNPNINFYVGVCILNSTKKRTDAIEFLEKAIKKTDPAYSYSYKETAAPVFAYLYLGQAYHLNQQFDTALANFKIFKSFLSNKNKDGEFLEEVTQCTNLSLNAKTITAKPVKVTIEPLKIANGFYSDYGAVKSVNGNKIYFSSKRKGNLGGQKDNMNEFFDDIYYIQLKDKKWVKPKKIGSKINTISSDVVNCISPDDKRLYFSRQQRGKYDIFYSEMSKRKKWQSPKKIGPNINTKDNEGFAFITLDGKTMLFSSDRPGGYGGYDIYISEMLSTGEWGKPFNLGSDVNSKYDEICPTLMPDGTLYFSSKGHTSIGGFDIFYTTLSESGLWSKPENFGYPINTVFDDTYFSISEDGKKGYYTSAKIGGYGETDIFQITFPQE